MIFLERRSAVPGHGWGCYTCGLPPEGKLAVLCDECQQLWAEDPEQLKIACRGYPAQDGRIAIEDLPPGSFEHDERKHLQMELIFESAPPRVRVLH